MEKEVKEEFCKSVKKWQKWLSVIGLIFLIIGILGTFTFGFSYGNLEFDQTSLGGLLVAIAVVIGIFSKK